MLETFITNIQVNKVRHLEKLTIELSQTERKHLILIGKNGSGKTILLEAINKFLKANHTDISGNFIVVNSDTINENNKSNLNIFFKMPPVKMLFYYFSVRYEPEFIVPAKAGSFKNIAKTLRKIHNREMLTISYNSKNLRHIVEMPNREPVELKELSDGHSAFFNMAMYLTAKIENLSNGDCNTVGVVIIDEIEKHLHIELQKTVLPFLAAQFPSIQFIVTTHSPFVIESFRGAVVYDLERKERHVVDEAKSVNETVRGMLGVPITMPLWAERKLNVITDKYLLQNVENISFEKMKKELEDAGLSSYFPECLATILQKKNDSTCSPALSKT